MEICRNAFIFKMSYAISSLSTSFKSRSVIVSSRIKICSLAADVNFVANSSVSVFSRCVKA